MQLLRSLPPILTGGAFVVTPEGGAESSPEPTETTRAPRRAGRKRSTMTTGPEAPMGLCHTAQGCAPGATLGRSAAMIDNPERVVSHEIGARLFPNVPFVPLHFVSSQETSELVSKAHLAVMFLLTNDVVTHSIELGRAD